jgi:hypothetical protein
MATGAVRTAEPILVSDGTTGFTPVTAPGSAFRPFPISVDRYHWMIAGGCIAVSDVLF